MPTDTDTTAISERIRCAMKAQRVSQVDMAGLLGITQPQVSARLRGEVDWRAGELLTATRRLGIQITIPPLAA